MTDSNKYSVQFDGINDLMLCGNDSSLDFEYNVPWSWVGWTKFDRLATAEVTTSRLDASNRGWELNKSGSNSFRFQLASSTVNRIRVYITTPFISTGTWYNLATTYDGSGGAAGVKIYLAGVSQGVTIQTNNLSSNTTVSSANMAYGARPDSVAPTQGRFDDSAIFNRVLTAPELLAIYNGGTGVLMSDLSYYAADCLAFHRFGDRSDSFPNIYDKKGVNDGVLTNMVPGDIVNDPAFTGPQITNQGQLINRSKLTSRIGGLLV